MSLNELQSHVLAYYTTGHGKDLSMTQRWYPHAELVMIIDDKIAVAVRKFGRKAAKESRAAATEFADTMIAKGVWATQKNDFGGTMHQFQLGAYPAALAEFNAANPVVQAATAGGETYWADKFAELTV